MPIPAANQQALGLGPVKRNTNKAIAAGERPDAISEGEIEFVCALAVVLHENEQTVRSTYVHRLHGLILGEPTQFVGECLIVAEYVLRPVQGPDIGISHARLMATRGVVRPKDGQSARCLLKRREIAWRHSRAEGFGFFQSDLVPAERLDDQRQLS